MSSFLYYKQRDNKDCGPTCLKIIAKYYNRTINIQQLREISETTRAGSSLLGLSEASEKLGFRSLGIKVDLKKLLEAPLPCILHWNKNHYVVLYKIKKEVFYISDPGHGLLKYSKEDFLKHWIGNNATDQTEEGIALLLEPTPKEKSSYIAKLKTPAQNSGKIKIGQRVNVKLENYPDTEFGVLNGKIKNMSLIPDKEGFYLIDVKLPKRLITSYNKEINFKQEMRGSAEIITEDLRLIERFFYQLINIFKR